MKNPVKFLVAGIIAILALIPPVKIQLACTVNSTLWLWGILIGGFLGFLFLYSSINIWLKLFVVFSYVNCFTSAAPYLSFTMYWSMLACVGFYVLCLRVTNWHIIEKTIQSLFFLTLLLVIMQQFQMDTLLNFNRKAAVFFGTINNPMMLASFIICLTPFLLLHNKINIIPISLAVWMSGSSGAILSLATGVLFYLFLKIKRKTVYVVLVFLIMTIVLSCSYLDWKTHPDANFPTFSLLGQRGLIWQRSLS